MLNMQDLPFKQGICPSTFLLNHPLFHGEHTVLLRKWCRDQLLYVSQKEDSLADASCVLADMGQLELQASYKLSREVPPMKNSSCNHPVYSYMRDIVKVCS